MNQPFNKTGEPGAVNPVFLTLQPNIRFKFHNGTLNPVAGCPTVLGDAETAYSELLKFARETVRQSGVKNGWACPSLAVICLGQVFNVPFSFQVINGEVVEPPFSVAKMLIHRKLRQLFN